MNKVYYNQADPRWANHSYTAPSYPNATVKSSGCGPTCGAMIISSCKETIYPDAMCDLAKANGYRVDGGTADGFFTFICQKWGLEIERIHSSYEALEKCKDGYFVVMVAGAGLWTTGGHFILAVGARNDEIQIYDPYLYAGKFNQYGRQSAEVKVEGTSCYVQIDKFKQYSNIQRLWAIKVSDVTPDEPINPETGEIKYVSANSGLNVRTGRGTQYSVVTTLPKGTQVMVYDTVDGWARIGSNMYVSAQYLSDSKSEETQPAQPTTRKGVVTANSGLNVRSGPSTSNGRVGALSKGATVTIYEESNGWYRIGNNQWVSAQYVSVNGQTPAQPTTKTMYVKVNSSLNVRSGPSTNNRIVGSLLNGTQVTVYEETSGWARIGDSKWVSAQYLTTSGTPVTNNTVGQKKVLANNTILYENSNLSGKQYTYLAGTSVKILQNVNGSIDKIYVIKTGRVAYCKNNVYR